MLIFENFTLNDLPGIACWVLKFAENEKIWVVEGEMGAGKTTFIQAVCRQLGVKVPVQSPTFSLVNEYPAGEKRIFHFDFYRLSHVSEALDFGVEEYLDSGSYCLLEWASRIEELLPDAYLQIKIELNENKNRTLTVRQTAS
jgi:tRNA threonylcarbamoyladenosine biosynthesis protein TsaE